MRTPGEIAQLPVVETTLAERQHMRDLLADYRNTSDEELLALVQWFRGNSKLEIYAHFTRKII